VIDVPSRTEDVRAALAGLGAAAPESVVVRETPISWVFLTGDRAFKLKKPVVLAFLDYGTPARRREMCREEVRLNRRLASDVYLGVRALAAAAGGLELADEDDPRAIDYLVEMRRYDEACTLAARLDRGEMRGEDVVAVAGVLADFHAVAPRVAAVASPALTVERRMTDNVHALLSIVEQRVEVDRVLALERFAHAFVVAHRQMLDARARGGSIREGHGDLRPEDVLLEDGRVQIVDCVEFDRAGRELDVADDLASLVTDLAARGLEHVARALVRAYRDAGGEPGDDALIAFYAANRALMRAKVALARAAQHPPTSATHGHESAAARDLLALAERFAWRARLPLVIVVCGVPASGKSHLAHVLAEGSGLAHLTADVTRRSLAGAGPVPRAGTQLDGDALNALTSAELGRRAAREVAARGGALVDAAFRRRADRDAFARAFADAAPLLFVECCAPPAALVGRASRRSADPARIGGLTVAVAERERASWETLDEVGPDAHVTVRTDRSVDAVVADLLGLLDTRIGRLRAARDEAAVELHGGEPDHSEPSRT
jgi:aminoglycoside phosphotransferase family enzyme/predicted kinase